MSICILIWLFKFALDSKLEMLLYKYPYAMI